MPTLDVAINALKAKHGARQFDDAAKKCQRGAKNLNRSLTSTQRGLDSLGSKFRTVAKAALGMAAVYKIGRFIKGSIVEMAKFEMELANVSTMLDETTMVYLPKYKAELTKLAIKYGEATTALSKGLYDILSASIDAAKALDVLEVAAMAAKAGLTDTGKAADILTTIINAYGFAAEDAAGIADILFATVKRGKTTFDELASSMGMVVSLAATAGLSIEEVSAALATMTRAGISTDMAVTSLKGILTTFLSPTKQNIVAARALGLELNTNTLRTIGLTGAVDKLGAANAEQIAATFTNVRALTGLSALLQATEGHTKDLAEATNAAGKTLEAFGKVSDTTTMKLARFREEWKATQRVAGEEFKPALTPALWLLRKAMIGVADVAPTIKAVAAPFVYLARDVLNVTAKVADSDLVLFNYANTLENAGEAAGGLADRLLGLNETVKEAIPVTKDLNTEWDIFQKQMADLNVDWRTLGRLEKNTGKSLELLQKKGEITDEATLKFIENAKKEAKMVEEAIKKARLLIREVLLEQELIGLTNDERERAIKLRELETATKILGAKASAELKEEYIAELEELQKMQELEVFAEKVRAGMGDLIRAPLTALLDETRDMGAVLEDVLRDIGRNVLEMLYEETITKPLQDMLIKTLTETIDPLTDMLSDLLSGVVSGAVSGIGGMIGAGLFAEKGLVLKNGRLQSFGVGGIINKPTIFPMVNGLGLMGEKGPEAVMPLTRDESGRLGVRAEMPQVAPSIKIINVLDTSAFEDYLSTGDGEKTIMNIMRRNQEEFKEVSL